jgi:hypothetical protein
MEYNGSELTHRAEPAGRRRRACDIRDNDYLGARVIFSFYNPTLFNPNYLGAQSQKV